MRFGVRNVEGDRRYGRECMNQHESCFFQRPVEDFVLDNVAR